jgi:hypothetical protein
LYRVGHIEVTIAENQEGEFWPWTVSAYPRWNLSLLDLSLLLEGLIEGKFIKLKRKTNPDGKKHIAGTDGTWTFCFHPSWLLLCFLGHIEVTFADNDWTLSAHPHWDLWYVFVQTSFDGGWEMLHQILRFFWQQLVLDLIHLLEVAFYFVTLPFELCRTSLSHLRTSFDGGWEMLHQILRFFSQQLVVDLIHLLEVAFYFVTLPFELSRTSLSHLRSTESVSIAHVSSSLLSVATIFVPFFIGPQQLRTMFVPFFIEPEQVRSPSPSGTAMYVNLRIMGSGKPATTHLIDPDQLVSTFLCEIGCSGSNIRFQPHQGPGSLLLKFLHGSASFRDNNICIAECTYYLQVESEMYQAFGGVNGQAPAIQPEFQPDPHDVPNPVGVNRDLPLAGLIQSVRVSGY